MDYNLINQYPYEFGSTPKKYAVFDTVDSHVYYCTDHWALMKVVYWWLKHIGKVI